MKSDNSDLNSYSSKFRRDRVLKLVKLIERNDLKNISVLDIGGTKGFWDMNLKYIPKGLIAEIDIVNLPPQESIESEVDGVTLRFYAGNALDQSSFKKSHYDLVHSNSVIEHVGNLSSQKKMAEQIQALASYYWVQSPAKCFPIEPHFYFPFFAYLPLGLKALLLRNLDLGYHKKESDWLESKIICEDTRLLTRKEYGYIFPTAKILTEKIFCFTKSYMATNLI